MVCADRADHVHICRAAHAGHFRSEGLGNLDRENSHASGCTIDQHLLRWLYLSYIAKRVQSRESGGGYGRRFFKREVGRLLCELRFSGAYILGAGAVALAEHFIARLEFNGREISDNRPHLPQDV